MAVTETFELALINTFERKNSQNPVQISKWGEFYESMVKLEHEQPTKKTSIGTQWSLPERSSPSSPPNEPPDWFWLQQKKDEDLTASMPQNDLAWV